MSKNIILSTTANQILVQNLSISSDVGCHLGGHGILTDMSDFEQLLDGLGFFTERRKEDSQPVESHVRLHRAGIRKHLLHYNTFAIG